MAFRVLSLDGGGSKGVYSLGVLLELEKKLGAPLRKHFDLIYGTSTGAIIGAALGLDIPVQQIIEFYLRLAPIVMTRWTRSSRSRSLESHLTEIFGAKKFGEFKTDLGIVATNCDSKMPLIFKSSVSAAHGLKSSFEPGFGCTIADAVQASAAAYPFFSRRVVATTNQGKVTAVDGGFIANNPTMLAFVDVTEARKIPRADIRILSVGAGSYPSSYPVNIAFQVVPHITSLDMIQLQFDANSNIIAKLFELTTKDVKSVRVNEVFNRPELGTSLFESDSQKLEAMQGLGRTTFGRLENEIAALFA